VRPNAEQKDYHDTADRRLYASGKRQRRDSGGADVKRDGNEVGDRDHVDRLI
jgi:hypothetical protein